MIMFLIDTYEMLAKLLERKKHNWTQEQVNRLNMSINYLNNLKTKKKKETILVEDS